jgi:hypothetical protein
MAHIDPTTGLVEAERAVDAQSVLAIAGSLFVTTWSSNVQTLLRLDPQTLAQIGRWRISSGHAGGAQESDLVLAGEGLWVAGGNRLVRLSLPNGPTTATVSLPGVNNSDVSTDSMGTMLIVGVSGPEGMAIERREPVSGALLATSPISGAFTPTVSGLIGDDLWVSEPTGMMGSTELYDATDLRPVGPPCNEGVSNATCIVGTNGIAAQVTDGRLWVTQGAGGPTRNFCGDIDGNVLATLPVPGQGNVLAIGSRFIFLTDSQGLSADKGLTFTEVSLPLACAGS